MDYPKIVKAITILMAEDDPDDRMLAKEALFENGLADNLYFVENGEELLDFLYRRGKYNESNAPRPGLILLDLNMPKMDGREALEVIKKDPDLKIIPVVVFTTSKAEQDIIMSYGLGVNSFISKPVTFDEFVKVTKRIGDYWFGIVELPNKSQTN